MIKVVDVNEEQATYFFFSDPKLTFLGLSDAEMAGMYKTKKYTFEEGSNYIGLQENNELIAIVRYEYFTNCAINHHIYLASKHHKTEMPRRVVSCLKEYVINTLKIYKVLVICPSTCEHVQAFALKHGFEKEGTIKNGLRWREQIIDLYIYGLELDIKEH